MALILKQGPSLEPLSLSDAKLFLRVDHDEEDLLLSSLITAARIYIETSLGLGMTSQIWALYCHDWPRNGALSLPLSPLRSLDHIALLDEDDNQTVIEPSLYDADLLSKPSQICFHKTADLPALQRVFNGLEFQFTVGFGNSLSDVPEPLVQAHRLIVAHWYERREPVALGTQAAQIPHTAKSLLNSYRNIGLS